MIPPIPTPETRLASTEPAVISPVPLDVRVPISWTPPSSSKPVKRKAYCPLKSSLFEVPAAITMVNVAGAFAGVVSESVTWTVNFDEPTSTGVPEIVAVPLGFEDSVRPAGSWPSATVQMYGATPPVAFKFAL